MEKKNKKMKVLALKNAQIDENSLFTHVSKIIEIKKKPRRNVCQS
jgi:hypothetical protein